MKAHAWVRALLASNLLTFPVIGACGYALVTGAADPRILGAVVATLSAAMFVLHAITIRLADGRWEEETPAETRPASRRKAAKAKRTPSAAWRSNWNEKATGERRTPLH